LPFGCFRLFVAELDPYGPRKELMIERSQHHAGKIFGITYFLSLLVIGVTFSRFYAPYLVWENGEETARHFITHEQSVRIYLAGAFLYGAGVIVQLTALYVILGQLWPFSLQPVDASA